MKEPKPVQRVELTEQNRKLRLIAAVLLFIIGIIGITLGVTRALKQDGGWQQVEISTQERNCSSQFVLQYNFAASGAQATAVNRTLQTVYSEACVNGYRLFTPDEEIAGVNNVHYLNLHPGEEIQVDPALYAAFETLADTRWLYLGPVYAHYSQIIYNSTPEYAAELDPQQNSQVADLLQTAAEFAADPEMVNLELLGGDRVCLQVSPAYRAFLEENELESRYLDFAYMTNAFVIDYLAGCLEAEGLTNGYLVSADGFTRNLTSDMPFRSNILDRVGNTVYPAAVMEYTGPVSMVYLKTYPTSDADRNYLAVEDSFIHQFADPADGIYRTSLENLVSYSYDTGCAQVLLEMLPCFVGSEFTVPQGVYSIWCQDSRILYNDPAIAFHDVLQTETVTYQPTLVQE